MTREISLHRINIFFKRIYIPNQARPLILTTHTRVYPDCSTLMEVANEWLRGNPSYGVWKCETVERRVESSGQVLMESMLFHEATYGFNVSINGIR